MAYNSDAFALDLDIALNKLTSIFTAWLMSGKRQSTNPHLLAGVTQDDAIAQTCLALVIREIPETEIREAFSRVMERTRSMLIDKNRRYGDSALNPLRLFSRAEVDEQLRVRIDDKVSRMVRGVAAGEDPADDMLGYFVLLLIADARKNAQL